jgi:catechol 2,3-dioxygenase-like lactoylglutathione lyase family enzyme
VSIDHVFAGIPVTDFAAARAWYVELFGREPDLLPHDTEAAWQLTDSAWVYIVADAERAGTATVTILVDDVDAWVDDADESIPGVRRAEIRDPDGNRLQFGQPTG